MISKEYRHSAWIMLICLGLGCAIVAITFFQWAWSDPSKEEIGSGRDNLYDSQDWSIPKAEEGPSIPAASLFEAISRVESNNNDWAIGLNGELGRYQITQDYWDDGLEELAKTIIKCPLRHYVETMPPSLFLYETGVYIDNACRVIMLMYWQRYGAETDEDRARLHNGGPTKAGTDEYWRKVKTHFVSEAMAEMAQNVQ